MRDPGNEVVVAEDNWDSCESFKNIFWLKRPFVPHCLSHIRCLAKRCMTIQKTAAKDVCQYQNCEQLLLQQLKDKIITMIKNNVP